MDGHAVLQLPGTTQVVTRAAFRRGAATVRVRLSPSTVARIRRVGRVVVTARAGSPQQRATTSLTIVLSAA